MLSETEFRSPAAFRSRMRHGFDNIAEHPSSGKRVALNVVESIASRSADSSTRIDHGISMHKDHIALIFSVAYDLSEGSQSVMQQIARAATRLCSCSPLAVSCLDVNTEPDPELVHFDRVRQHCVSRCSELRVTSSSVVCKCAPGRLPHCH